MRAALALLLVASSANASPRCPSPHVRTYPTLAAAKVALGANPPQAVPDLADRGKEFFVDVPLGSPNGSDAVIYKVDAIFVQADRIVVVDDLARWASVMPAPGSTSPKTPAQTIRIDATTAHLAIRDMREALVDVLHAKFLGCAR
jgi:hypothetical protein